MFVNGDIKGLEVVACAELSGDKVLTKELIDREDIHGNNQRYFGFPAGDEGRLVAKVFKFRLIYGGSAYAYSKDPDFMGVSTSERYWQGVIDRYYEKYQGVRQWHDGLLDTVRRQGYIEIPSGRVFPFEPGRNGFGLKWPLTKIKNYPVQGYGADLVMLARIELDRLIEESGLEALLVMTVHDSLLIDTPSKNVYNISELITKAVESVPRLVKENWDHDFKLPMLCEIKTGPNKRDLKKIQ